jgi:hypothetical protein
MRSLRSVGPPGSSRCTEYGVRNFEFPSCSTVQYFWTLIRRIFHRGTGTASAAMPTEPGATLGATFSCHLAFFAVILPIETAFQ